MGVRRAVEIVLDAANVQDGPIYTVGPLIHNPQVLELLEEKGVCVLDDPSAAKPGRAIIRAHGHCVGPCHDGRGDAPYG